MPAAAQRRPALSQSSFDFIVGGPTKVTFSLKEASRILGVSVDSVIGLWDSGQIWGHEHDRIKGNGDNVKRVIHRDAIVAYLVIKATRDDEMKVARACEMLASFREREHLLRLRSFLDSQLNETTR